MNFNYGKREIVKRFLKNTHVRSINCSVKISLDSRQYRSGFPAFIYVHYNVKCLKNSKLCLQRYTLLPVNILFSVNRSDAAKNLLAKFVLKD